MKTILATVTSFFLFLTCVMAQVPGQPECLGLTLGSPGWRYATLFEPTCRFYFTCTHWHPDVGVTLTFGNGQTGIVKKTHHIRGGYYGGYQYDLAIGELEAPVSAKPASVRWTERFITYGPNTKLDGFGIDGWFVGEQLTIDRTSSSEVNKGIWFTTNPYRTVRHGYSGSPIFYKGDLVAINWGEWSITGGNSGGVATMISMVLEQYWQLFPSFLHPPTEPSITTSMVGNMLHVALHTPAALMNRMQIVASSNLTPSSWRPADRRYGFNGYVTSTPSPWQTIIKWDVSASHCMMFRGDDSWAAD